MPSTAPSLQGGPDEPTCLGTTPSRDPMTRTRSAGLETAPAKPGRYPSQPQWTSRFLSETALGHPAVSFLRPQEEIRWVKRNGHFRVSPEGVGADLRRYCARCDRSLPRESFGRDASKGSGLKSICRECDREKAACVLRGEPSGEAEAGQRSVERRAPGLVRWWGRRHGRPPHSQVQHRKGFALQESSFPGNVMVLPPRGARYLRGYLSLRPWCCHALGRRIPNACRFRLADSRRP